MKFQIQRVSSIASVIIFLVGIFALANSHICKGATFTTLGFLAGYDRTLPNGISDDGSVVVGSAGSSTTVKGQAFRWTASGGIIGLDYLPGGTLSFGEAVSGDGSFTVGASTSADSPSSGHGALWPSSGIPSAIPGSFAFGVSGDNSVIVGGNGHAYRYTIGGATLDLGDLPDGRGNVAYGASYDGSVVVGTANTNSGYEPFRWTAATGMVGLGNFSSGNSQGFAHAVSGDGSIVVGWSNTDVGDEAFRWTASDGMVGLGFLPNGGTSTLALGISSDGSKIVGEAGLDGHNAAFFWSNTLGMVEMKDYLTSQGLDLDGWTLTGAEAISPDGNAIVGTGISSTGSVEAWIAVVPEPSTMLMALSGIIGCIQIYRRGSKR